MAENNLPDETDKKDVLDSAGYHIMLIPSQPVFALSP
jgi:hypothetical protein